MTTRQMDDRYAWAGETARRLRAGEQVDLTAVAEELEQMGRYDLRELESRITQILEHLLKLRLAPPAILDYNQRGWKASIIRQRDEIHTLFEESPSLEKRVTAALIRKRYRGAADVVAVEFDVKPPTDCPFSPQDVLES